MATINTTALIQRVYHPRSNGYKALNALAGRFEATNNTNGTSLLNRILVLLAQKDITHFSGVVERRYVRREETGVRQRVGVADTSGQRCRWLHVVDLRAYDRDGSLRAHAGVAKGAGNTVSVGELHVGSNVLETLDLILDSGFKPAERASRKKEKNQLIAGLAAAGTQYDDLFGRITGNPDLADTYRRLLEFGPLHAGRDPSILRTLADPQALRSDLAWLRASMEVMPPSVVMAYYNHMGSGKTTPEDAATLVAAVQQFKQQKREALIGGFRKDITYLDTLPDDHDVFRYVKRPDLDAPFKTLRLVKDAVLPAADTTPRRKIDEAFLTVADALSLCRGVPGLDEARRHHNSMVAARFASAQEFPSLYETAVKAMDEERSRIAEAKKHKEQVKHMMDKKEYLAVKSAEYLVTLARDGARGALVRLTPMPDAEGLFRAIALVGRKAKAGLPQSSDVVLRQDVSFTDEQLGRLAYTPLKAREAKYLAARAEYTTRALVAAQEAARRQADGLVPHEVAALDSRLKDGKRGEFLGYLCQAQPAGKMKEGIDRLLALHDSPIGLDALGRTAATGALARLQSDPRFDITSYKDAAYLMPEDRRAVENVVRECHRCLGNVDIAALTAGWRRVEDAVAAGARFYTIKRDPLDYSCRAEEVKPRAISKRADAGLSYRDPREIAACIDALGNKASSRSDAINRIREAQGRRAPGYDTGLASLLDEDAYLLPAGREAITATADAIRDGDYPAHATDALDAASVTVYNTPLGGTYHERFAVEVRSEGHKPWIEVLNAFSRKKGGIGTPARFEWHFDDDFGKCRLYSTGASRRTVTDTLEQVAHLNLKRGSRVVLALRALT